MENSKDNMYEFITKRENPLAGECKHNCTYCYVKRMKWRPNINKKYSGEIRLDETAFKKKFKKEDFIFICTCNDLFASGVPKEYILKIIDFYNQFESTNLFQTKNPCSAINYDFSDNSILCTTIETNRWYKDIMGNTPFPIERANAMKHIDVKRKFVTIEPIMDFDLNILIDLMIMIMPEQINIGADSGHNNLPEPAKEKVLELIPELKKFTNVHLKDNLYRIIKA